MRQMKRGAVVLATTVVGLGLVSAGPAVAGDDDGRVETAGTCAGGGRWELKAKHDDGRIEWEFEVDTNRRGQTFTVAVTDNGTPVFRGRRTTSGPSGSFSLERTSADRAGADVIRAVARRGGQVCRGQVRV